MGGDVQVAFDENTSESLYFLRLVVACISYCSFTEMLEHGN